MTKDIKIPEGKPGLLGHLLWKIGCFGARIIFNKKLNIQYENWDIITQRQGPFLIVGNHVTNFDPVIITANQKHLIHWVATDAVFRHPFLRWAFSTVHVIPKTKGTSDLDTVRGMHKKIRDGGVVAVFPEGHTSWDGVSQELTPATAKLIKLFKVPVVAVVMKRAYLCQPRWVWPRNFRPSRINAEAKLLFQEEELKKLKVHEIESRLNEALWNDDFAYQKENPLPLKSEKRAETLELFTYICPKCKTIDSLVSKGNSVFCSSCSWEFSIDQYGQFPEKDFPFASLHEWNLWQQDETLRIVKAYTVLDNPGDPLTSNEGVTMLTSQGLTPLKIRGKGSLKLWKDCLELQPAEGETIIFPFDQIEALSIFKQQKVEFYFNKLLYRFHFSSPRDSAYKWLKFLEIMTSL